MAAIATQISRNCSTILSFQLPNNTKPGIRVQSRTASLKRLPTLVRAKPQTEESNGDKAAFVSQEDLKYLVQLGGGSVAGAAAIKYGSVIFPAVTQPNLAQALFMIFAPTLVAVLLLFKQSTDS